MTFEAWMLLGFATWTIVLLMVTVGIYRWNRILRGRAEIREFGGDVWEGEDWYLRSMRAHLNCVENLPVFGAIVFVLYLMELSTPATRVMAAVVLGARLVHSILHVAFEQTNAVAAVRFAFFFVQLLCFLGLIATAVGHQLLG